MNASKAHSEANARKAQRTYLDHNAGAPLLPKARDAVLAALARTGNASSVHAEGRDQRKAIEGARAALAAHLDCAPRQVIFTSGATEAANQALTPRLRAGSRYIRVSTLYVSAVEHPCVLAGGRFETNDIVHLPVTESGLVDLAALDSLLGGHDGEAGAPMVAVMLANNETGAIQPIAEIASIVRAHDGFLVVDAVQGLGKLPFTVGELGAHFIMLSAHKIGGPQGAGALVLGDPSLQPQALLKGGGQENFLRAGTENVAAIAGFGAAVATLGSRLAEIPRLRDLRDSIEARLHTISREAGNRAGEPVFFVRDVDRLANTSCFAVPGVKAETALISLDLAGVAVSSGSACSSGRLTKSHVLAAMGVNDELAASAIRLSLGWDSSEADAGRFLSAWTDIVRRLG